MWKSKHNIWETEWGTEVVRPGPVQVEFMYLPQDEERMHDNAERILDRKGVPPKKPGDEYTLGGMLIGIIIGIMAGGFFGLVWVFIVGAIGGGIIGTLIGSAVGERIMKKARPNNKLN